MPLKGTNGTVHMTMEIVMQMGTFLCHMTKNKKYTGILHSHVLISIVLYKWISCEVLLTQAQQNHWLLVQQSQSHNHNSSSGSPFCSQSLPSHFSYWNRQQLWGCNMLQNHKHYYKFHSINIHQKKRSTLYQSKVSQGFWQALCSFPWLQSSFPLYHLRRSWYTKMA